MTAAGGETRDAPLPDSGSRHALLVGSGIFLSRIAGLVRQRVFAHYFGLSAPGDAFNAAFRIPNLLQNLFGEGVLSGSFIPVYARLLADRDEEEAGRVAGATFALLALAVSVIVLAGVLGAPLITGLLAAGFEGEKRELTVRLVRVLFPGAGLLVISAWCLGILNSHRRFLLSYAAPVIWNAAMIAALLLYGGASLDRLATMLAWGSVVGSALQLLIQLPLVLRLVRALRFTLDRASSNVREVTRHFGTVFVGRGVVQISAYIDALIASFLPTGAVTAIMNAQTLYLLPVSLFGMAVSAAELPAMSAAGSGTDATLALRARVAAGLRRIAFFVVPSAVAFLLLGDVLAGLVFRTGRFGAADARYVWSILACSAIGVLAATMGRLLASALYAQRDPRTPLRYAAARVAITVALGWTLAIPVPRLLGLHPSWGAAGLSLASGFAACVEYMLLKRAVTRRIGAFAVPAGTLAKLTGAALVGGVAAWGVRSLVADDTRWQAAILVLGIYGVVYLLLTVALRVPEGLGLVARVARRGRTGVDIA